VLAYSGSPIEIVRGTVINIHASRDGSQIDSITLRTDSGDSDPATDGISTVTSVKTIATSLFVDCSGPSSISAKMLPAARVGWGPFPRHQYDPVVSYRTAFVTVPEDVREAISRSVPKGDIDYGRWDRMTTLILLHPHQKLEGMDTQCKESETVVRFIIVYFSC